jgi:hypothetical protein
MIQRVQSIYLALTIICLSLVTFGSHLISFITPEVRFDITSNAIIEKTLDAQQTIDTDSILGYLVTGGLLLMAIITLLSFKSLTRQFRLGRMLFLTYTVVLISFVLLFYLGQDLISKEITRKELGTGFIFLVIGLPFSFLANVGIKKDKNLIDSLNRLR